jgi:hypothetical protein
MRRKTKDRLIVGLITMAVFSAFMTGMSSPFPTPPRGGTAPKFKLIGTKGWAWT